MGEPPEDPNCDQRGYTPKAAQRYGSEKEVLEALNSGATPNLIWNGAIILSAGDPVHAEPFLASPQEAHEGEVWLSPRLYRDNDDQIWAAALQGGAALPGAAVDIDRTVWVNIEQIEADFDSDYRAFEGYNPLRSPKLCVPFTIKATVAPGNSLQTGADNPPEHIDPAEIAARIRFRDPSTLDGISSTYGLVPEDFHPF